MSPPLPSAPCQLMVISRLKVKQAHNVHMQTSKISLGLSLSSLGLGLLQVPWAASTHRGSYFDVPQHSTVFVFYECAAGMQQSRQDEPDVGHVFPAPIDSSTAHLLVLMVTFVLQKAQSFNFTCCLIQIGPGVQVQVQAEQSLCVQRILCFASHAACRYLILTL